jgi:Domain of unknown function (DUF4279)
MAHSCRRQPHHLERGGAAARASESGWLEPDKSWAKGDALGAVGMRRCNGLTYESGLDDKRSPTEHLAALIERLHPCVEGIREVSAWPTTHCVTVWVAEHTITDNPEVFVEPDDLGAIAAMKAKLAIDVYFYADEDE